MVISSTATASVENESETREPRHHPGTLKWIRGANTENPTRKYILSDPNIIQILKTQDILILNIFLLIFL